MIDENTETFFAALQRGSPEDILIVGIGNSLKADDGIGSEICSQLKESIDDNVIDAGTVPENYIQVIINKSPKTILFIDAIDFGSPAGTVRIFDPCDLTMGGISSHTLSPRILSDMIANNAVVKIYFIGIQPKSTRIGQPMCREVESAKNELLKQLNRLFFIHLTTTKHTISSETLNDTVL